MSHALHAHLGNLPVVVFLGAVDGLVIIHFLFRGRVVFDNRKGNIRLEGQKGTVEIGKCDKLIVRQKVPVIRIEIIGLELGHLELPVTELLI